MHVINDDGSNAVKLTSLEGSIGRSSWSPDGSKIAYQSGGDIYVLNSDGTNIVMLTDNSGKINARDANPFWSPDGTYIAFDRSRDTDPGGWDIYVMKSDGSNQVQITSGSSAVNPDSGQ